VDPGRTEGPPLVLTGPAGLAGRVGAVAGTVGRTGAVAGVVARPGWAAGAAGAGVTAGLTTGGFTIAGMAGFGTMVVVVVCAYRLTEHARSGMSHAALIHPEVQVLSDLFVFMNISISLQNPKLRCCFYSASVTLPFTKVTLTFLYE
jgi:hypothetical protein